MISVAVVGIGIGIAAAALAAAVAHPIAKETAKILSNSNLKKLPRSKEDVSRGLLTAAVKSVVDVYEYSKSVVETAVKTVEKTPHVHHIVPVGKFSNRSQKTIYQINQMHEKLASVGINRFVDPMNLIVVSAKTHATLHTDEFINHVHSYIMASGDSRMEVYGTLFYLRLEIAAWDIHAHGF